MDCFSDDARVFPPLRGSVSKGETSRFVLLGGTSLLEVFLAGGDRGADAGASGSKGGVSVSGENALDGAAPGGKDGKAFSFTDCAPLAADFALVFDLFLRRAMSAS